MEEIEKVKRKIEFDKKRNICGYKTDTKEDILRISEIENILNYIEELEEYKQNSIPKEKIQNRIDEYEELLKDFEQTFGARNFKRQKSIDYYKKEALQELLEGGKENE